MVQATADDPTHDILLYLFPDLVDNADVASNLKRKLTEPEDGPSLSLPADFCRLGFRCLINRTGTDK